jgi:hypothetical protein
MRQNESLVDFDDDAIRKIAYNLWERRGAPIGSPDVDWIEAERQLRDLPADGQQPETNLKKSAHAGASEDAGSFAETKLTRGLQP